MPICPMRTYQARVEHYICEILPKENKNYPALMLSMEYSLFNGGKRLRPALVYMTAKMLGTPLYIADCAAAAVELVHCFSLIHDDLPAMDNSDFRRGQPSCHKVFGDDVAILAGDALLTLAFDILSQEDINHISHRKQLKMIQLLCEASGCLGMVAGQVMDIKNTASNTYNLQQLKTLHELKTGALIRNSILMGGTISLEPQQQSFKTLTQFGDIIGLLYQVCDDILDVTADATVLGKEAGTDLALGKTTYVDLLGLSGAKDYATELCDNAKNLLGQFNQPEELTELTEHICQRAL